MPSLDPDVLIPVITSLVPELLKLMNDAELMETKRKIDGVLCAVIAQAGMRVIKLLIRSESFE